MRSHASWASHRPGSHNLEAGQSGLVSRQADHRDTENRRLTTKVGEQTMAIELLEEKIEVLEDGLRPPRRRSRS